VVPAWVKCLIVLSDSNLQLLPHSLECNALPTYEACSVHMSTAIEPKLQLRVP